MEAMNFYGHHATATASLQQLVDAHRMTEASEKALKLKVSKLEAEREVWREDAGRSDALVKDRNAKLEILTLKLGQLGRMSEVTDGSTASTFEGPPVVACVLDGDGCVLDRSFLTRGHGGGCEAASLLHDRIKDLSGLQYPSICVTVICNLAGLARTLVHAQIIDSEEKLTHFFQGFTSSRSLFTMVDIGESRDAAETKILDTIGFWARLPSTERVFAGCAPNSGYISLLNSLVEDNRADGVSLLKSTSSAVSNPHLDRLKTTTMIGMFERQKFDIIPLPSSPSPTSPLSRPFSSVLARGPPSNPTPTADARLASSHGATSDYFKSFRKSNLRTRPIDPFKPLTKQLPPPCNRAYLSKNGCYNQKCQRAHDYDLTPDQIEQLRRSVNNQPCRHILEGNTCYQPDCFYAHICPRGPQCDRSCKFSEVMHLHEF